MDHIIINIIILIIQVASRKLAIAFSNKVPPLHTVTGHYKYSR